MSEHTGADGAGGERSRSVDTAFGPLAHPHRRLVLAELDRAAGGRLSVDELTASVLDRVGTDPDGDVERQLHHTHLPKLENEGVLEYDWDSSMVTVRSGDRTTELLEALAAMDE